jgi:hypothetical protein
MGSLHLVAAVAMVAWGAEPAAGASTGDNRPRPAQTDVGPVPPQGSGLVSPVTERWEFGIAVTARGDLFRHMVGTFPLPGDWPEQQVRILAQDTSKVRRLGFQEFPGGSRQVVAEIEPLRPGEQARAVVTVELVRREIAVPGDTDAYTLPQAPLEGVQGYLRPSPQIESDRPEIVAAATRLVGGGQSAWQQVESIYHGVLDQVKYRKGPPKGALAALRSRRGNWEDRTSLFIAMCRANNVPARLVWLPGRCYAEFCLEDEHGERHWFPSDVGEEPQLGSLSGRDPILQKGDRFEVPGEKTPQRYLSERLTGCSVVGRAQPKFEVIRRRAE